MAPKWWERVRRVRRVIVRVVVRRKRVDGRLGLRKYWEMLKGFVKDIGH